MTIETILKNKGNAVISVSLTTTVLEVAEIIASKRIGAVLVIGEDGGLAGIVSERDVVKAVAKNHGTVADMTAEELMTRDVTTATPRTTVDEAMSIMDSGYFRHLPVLDNGKLAGIISVRDVVKHRLMLHEHDVDTLKSYIHRGA